MGINNRRSMGTENFTRGFEIRISRNSSLDRYKTHFCQCEESTYYFSRGRRFNTKKCNRDCTSNRDTSRFLQYTFSGSKENRRFKTCDKLKTSQPVSEEATFQNGHFNKSFESSKTPRLGVVSRSERCISPYSSSQNTQKVSTFLHTRQMLPICSSVFRSFSSTSSVHKNSYGSSSSSENSKHTPSNLFGRLVASECSRENANFRQRDNTQSSDKTGIYSKSSKIFSYPITRDHLHRGIIQFQEGDSFSNYGKNFKIRNVSDKLNEGTQYRKRLSNVVGFDSVLHRIDPQCTPLYEAYPITSTSFLETIYQRSFLSNSIYSTPKRSFELVVGQSKHYQGQIITPVVGNPHNNNRCFKDRVWGSHEQSDFSRFLVCSRTETTHKSLGIGSCNSNSTTFPTTITKSKCATQMRQHNSRSICKQTGGHQVHTPLLQDMVSNENGYSEQSDIQSSSHSGEIKRSCRSSVSKQNTTHRVDTEQSDSSISVCNVGRTNNRFVCLSTQSQETSVLCLDTSSQCSSSRRSVDIMGKNVGICISTNMSNSKSTKTHESIQLSTNSDSFNVAKKTLVHRASSKISSKSNKTTNKAKSSVSTKNKHLPSKSRSVHANSLAALHKNFRNKGFSRETRKLLRASWRSGTQQDYACKFKRFHSWCKEREKDPYAATLAECADFLSHLYTSGLQYRTIAGYRSMLSSLLSPIDNVPIGQHPYIIRLLRGVFNSRPPKVNLVPEWDLQKVLDMLQKSPFEPLLKADIKCLTYKVVFLTAITTFRRCSDLQALRIS
ncbi:uncharacterized protein LOC134694156 [Mytilus trossulus]|uniref:uncharacterized protein LOC134694156 n=1 Tax=Mytilus trossulus TaxID=6551 RepID=UPI0030068C32